MLIKPLKIIISKQGLNTAKNNRGNNLSQLTLKDGEHSVKINLNTSFDHKINKDNILQTISDYRKKFMLLQKHKNNKFHHYKTSIKENNRQKYKNELINEKNFSSYNSVDALQDIIKLDKDKISNNSGNENKTLEIDNKNINKNYIEITKSKNNLRIKNFNQVKNKLLNNNQEYKINNNLNLKGNNKNHDFEKKTVLIQKMLRGSITRKKYEKKLSNIKTKNNSLSKSTQNKSKDNFFSYFFLVIEPLNTF